tara:strand:- start:607 stop:903 length:297 start_codon:yes stop_codon:yes gene_type:complete
MNDKKKVIDNWHSWAITADRLTDEGMETVNLTVDFTMMNPELVEPIEKGLGKIPTYDELWGEVGVENECRNTADKEGCGFYEEDCEECQAKKAKQVEV